MSILVYTENWDGNFKKSTFELLSFGKALADKMNLPLTALSIGRVSEEKLQELGKYGAGKVLSNTDEALQKLDNQAYTKVIAEAAKKENATVILLAHNNSGKALAPRLAVRCQASLGSGLTQLPDSTDPFVITKKVYSGKAFAQVELQKPVRVLSLQQNSFEIAENPLAVTIEEFTCDYGEIKTRVLESDKQGDKLLLSDAEIVVSGGRGMKGPENWGMLEELATTLGAATACTRPVSDEGWRPHGEHTGQTGKIIAPNLYIAAGISGAIQHLAGVSGSKCLVAINTDKDAPIFEAADYGIVGDALKVIPEMTKAIKEL